MDAVRYRQKQNKSAFKVEEIFPPQLTLNLYVVQVNERQNRFADLKYKCLGFTSRYLKSNHCHAVGCLLFYVLALLTFDGPLLRKQKF